MFPNNKVIIKINPKNPPTAADLSLKEWKVIMQVDGQKTLQEIIQELAIGEEESLAIFHDLLHSGMQAEVGGDVHQALGQQDPDGALAHCRHADEDQIVARGCAVHAVSCFTAGGRFRKDSARRFSTWS